MKAVRWEETKRRAREINPDWDSPERVAARERSREELRAEQRGYQLAQLRKNAGLTQAQVAAAMAVSRARVVPDRAWQDHRDGRGPCLCRSPRRDGRCHCPRR